MGGPKRDEMRGDCRKWYYERLYLYPSNIIRVIKWRTMKLVVHVAREDKIHAGFWWGNPKEREHSVLFNNSKR